MFLGFSGAMLPLKDTTSTPPCVTNCVFPSIGGMSSPHSSTPVIMLESKPDKYTLSPGPPAVYAPLFSISTTALNVSVSKSLLGGRYERNCRLNPCVPVLYVVVVTCSFVFCCIVQELSKIRRISKISVVFFIFLYVCLLCF